MNPLDFLQTCDRLAQSSPRQEADDRTVLSRVYYAFFLTLRDGLAAKDVGFRANVKNSGAEHALVRDYLKGVRFSPSQVRNVAGGSRVSWYERYVEVFRYREDADYRMELAPEEIRTKVDQVLADLPRLRPFIESLVS